MVKSFFNTHSRTDRQLALLLFAATLGLYIRTLAPGLLFGDAGEFQVAAWRLGLAHPTGYPLYLLLGSAWQHLLTLFGLSPAYALNMLSALLGAASVALLYLWMMQWLQSVLAVRRLAALFTAILFAINFTFWSQTLIAEVYTLHILFVLLIFSAASQLLRQQGETADESMRASASQLVILLALLVGLALTHHAMTLLLLPSLGLVLWQVRRLWINKASTWLWAFIAVLVPLALYLYIPLRSGAAASPWYHQPLGATSLTLYQNTWAAFWNFITGQSISVGFRDLDGANQQIAQAWLLWRLHLLWPGLVLAGLGLYALVRRRHWALLALTVPFFLGQQLFNLFYAIDDILVYYIPLYLIATIWAGFAADAIGGGMQALMRETPPTDRAAPEPVTHTVTRTTIGGDIATDTHTVTQTVTKPEAPRLVLPVGMVLVLVLFWLPIQLITRDFARLDQSNAIQAQTLWQTIAAAQPPTNAILVSNDRNEMVPLFYQQAVTGEFQGSTALFPLIAPEARFADIGATLETALAEGNGRPVYLIKPMPELAVKFTLAAATPPLIQVVGPAVTSEPVIAVQQPLGPLLLLGYDGAITATEVQITLYWQVQAALPADYVTTVQLLAANRDKVAQSDALPGGVYYPTSLWKPGEVLVEQHTLALEGAQPPTTLLVGMYRPGDLTPLAPPLELAWPPDGF